MLQEIAGIEAELQGGNTLTLRVTGREEGVPLGTFLHAIESPLKILRELDRRLSDGSESLEWRIVAASYNSPLMLRLKGIPIRAIGRPPRVAEVFLDNLTELEAGHEPEDLSDVSLDHVRRFVNVIASNGIARVEFDCPGKIPFAPTLATAVQVEQILKHRYYHEHSELDGRLDTIDLHGSPKFTIYDPLTHLPVACAFGDELLPDVVAALGKRVSVEGRVKFNRAGKPVSMEVEDMRILRGSDEIPDLREPRTIDITGGIESVEYLRSIRDVE